MTLQHGNRIRKKGGEQVVREFEVSNAVEVSGSGPTEDQIRQRAHEIYLSRNGAPGDAMTDWLQAETELRLFARP